MHHSAQTTRTGWNSKRMNLAASESNPKASVPVTNCEMFPGKMTMKKAATTQPTAGRKRFGAAMSARPSISSTTPEIATTASGKGIHGGTCARNASALAK